MSQNTLTIRPPLGGISRKSTYQTQPPFSSYDSLNFWPIDAKTGRQTSAIRPGLKWFGFLNQQVSMLSKVNGISTLGPPQSFAAAYNGVLYYWNGTSLTAATGSQSSNIDANRQVSAAPVVNQLAITKSTGPPLLFDYPTGTVETLVASTGVIPVDASIAVNWQGALWLATDNVASASRVGDITDWDFSAPLTDLFGAFFTDSEYKGLLSGPITALMPQTSDLMLVSTVSGTLAMRGHPRQGGVFEAVGSSFALGQGAWCLTPGDVLLMLTPLGLMSLAPTPGAVFSPVSRNQIPDELLGLTYNLADPNVTMLYDTRWHGVHIYVRNTEEQAWWFDLETGGFHRMNMDTYPFVVAEFADFISAHTSGALLGRYDGIHQYDRFATEDKTSSLIIGPVKISKSPQFSSKIVNARVTFARDTPNDDTGILSIATGMDGQDAVHRLLRAEAQYEISLSELEANNGMCFPSLTGHAAVFSVRSESGDVAIEEITCEITTQGKLLSTRGNQIPTLGVQTEFVQDDDVFNPNVWNGYSEITPQIAPCEDLPDYTHFFDLSLMPDSWWALVATPDGSDIRVSTVADVELPQVVVDFDLTAKQGLLIFKFSQTIVPQSIRVWVGAAGRNANPANDPNGQYNAFDSFWHSFYHDANPAGNLTQNVDTGTVTEIGSLTYGDVAGPVGGRATNFDIGSQATWFYPNWIADHSLGSNIPYTLISAFRRTSGTNTCELALLQGLNPSFRHSVTAAVSGPNATSGARKQAGPASSVLTAPGGIALNTWHHHTGTTNAALDRAVAFLDGGLKATSVSTSADPALLSLNVGTQNGVGPVSQGEISLVQVHTTVRSDCWIEYQGAMMDQSAFWNIPTEPTTPNPPPDPPAGSEPPSLSVCPSGTETFTETGNWAGYAEATPDNGVPGSNERDFTWILDLSTLPADWWTAVEATGADVRVTDEFNNLLPFDLIEFDKGDSTGLLTMKQDRFNGTVVTMRIWAGNPAAVAVPPCTPYGQYEAYGPLWLGFWPDGSGLDRTKYQTHMVSTGSPVVVPKHSPLGNTATLYTNPTPHGSTPQQYSIAVRETLTTRAEMYLAATVQLPSGSTNFPFAYIASVTAPDTHGGGYLYCTPNAEPARLRVTNYAGNVSKDRKATGVITPVTDYWTTIGRVRGALADFGGATVSTNFGPAESISFSGVGLAAPTNRIGIARIVDHNTHRAWNGHISLVVYRSRSSALDDSWHDMVHDQTTFWGTWNWTADSTALGQ